jgi:hypothetical protein
MDCPPDIPKTASPRSCASCDQTACHMNLMHRVDHVPNHKTTFLLDDVWPEYAEYIVQNAKPEDSIIAPGLFGKARISRYAWGMQAQHIASWQTILRHIHMRRVAKASGGIRQAAYLKSDAQITAALGKTIPIESRHLVIAQSWLPFLAQAGILGGRSYDVLMQRYPLADIHKTLDAIAKKQPDSVTISDFRAPEILVRSEAGALAGARKIITPHHGIAALFPQQAYLLNWHQAKPADTAATGTRTAFIGAALTRHRPDLVRTMAQHLPEPLIIYGESGHKTMWDGIAIEQRRMGPDWLRDVGTILHPSAMVHQPRKLLEAVAAGVTVHASTGCGLDPADYIPIQG